jgi:hypothetical protein
MVLQNVKHPKFNCVVRSEQPSLDSLSIREVLHIWLVEEVSLYDY